MLPRTKFPKLKKAVFLIQVSPFKDSLCTLKYSSNKVCLLHNTSLFGKAISRETSKVAIKISGRKKAKVFISHMVHIQSKVTLEQPNQEGTEKARRK